MRPSCSLTHRIINQDAGLTSRADRSIGSQGCETILPLELLPRRHNSGRHCLGLGWRVRDVGDSRAFLRLRGRRRDLMHLPDAYLFVRRAQRQPLPVRREGHAVHNFGTDGERRQRISIRRNGSRSQVLFVDLLRADGPLVPVSLKAPVVIRTRITWNNPQVDDGASHFIPDSNFSRGGFLQFYHDCLVN